jgi:hypothetical protein
MMTSLDAQMFATTPHHRQLRMPNGDRHRRVRGSRVIKVLPRETGARGALCDRASAPHRVAPPAPARPRDLATSRPRHLVTSYRIAERPPPRLAERLASHEIRRGAMAT